MTLLAPRFLLAAAVAGGSVAAVSAFGACHTHELSGAPVLAGVADGGAADGAAPSFNVGDELKVPVPGSGRAYVKLASPPSIVTPANPATDQGWDVAFGGVDAFTNNGVSGSGQAGAFGPLDTIVFLGSTAPSVPFFNADVAGGAFSNWFVYDADAHMIYSRFHVFGVKDGDKIYRVQILDYYSEPDSGQPEPAHYRIRYGEIGQPNQDAVDLDATAGGMQPTPDSPSVCLDLGTGVRTMLTVSAARSSSAWHLCFRRSTISVNGGVGGPRNIGAVDLQANLTADETLPDLVAETAASELPLFDDTTAQSFTNETFAGDQVISAFSGWAETTAGVLAPQQTGWLVLGADGISTYLVGFERFEGATATSLGTVVMRVKAVK